MDVIIKNLGLLINATLIATPPLLLAALGSCFSERSGVINIGIEGMMTIGAFTGAVLGLETGNGWLAFWERVLRVRFWRHSCGRMYFLSCRSDHCRNCHQLLGPGLAVFLCKAMYNNSSDTPAMDPASKLPKLLRAYFQQAPF